MICAQQCPLSICCRDGIHRNMIGDMQMELPCPLLTSNQWHTVGTELFPTSIFLGGYGQMVYCFTWHNLYPARVSTAILVHGLLFEQKKILLWNKWHLVKHEAKVTQHIFRIQYISLLPKIYKINFLGAYLHAALKKVKNYVKLRAPHNPRPYP
jgi:hypothetical protein